MVKVVVGNCRRPIQPFVLSPAFWKNFEAQMPDDIPDNHVQKEKGHNNRMQGYCEHHNGKDQCLYQRFPWMKRIGRPRRGIGRFMMHTMNMPENLLMVHEPVCPIEVEVVKEQGEYKTKDEIEHAIVRDVFVYQREPGVDG